MKKLHYVPGLFLILFLMFGVNSYSLALEVPVFSPLRYSVNDVQGTAIYTDTVTMGNVVSGEFHLIVQNGSGGDNKVDYAEIIIGGKRLVKLKSSKDFIDKKFKLTQDGEMRIQLTGQKNSFVVVSIIAKKLTQVPLVIRMAQDDAQAAMTSSLLKIKKKPTFANHGYIPTGSAMSQTPKAGTYVKEKTKATIIVSKGPAQIISVLPGDPSALASAAIVDYDIDDRVSPSEIETTPSGFQTARTQLEIGFTDNATISQINTVLQSVNAVIVGMLTGMNQLIMRIPDPGDLPGLDAVVATLQASPYVRYVLKATMPVPASLPPNFLDPTGIPWDMIDHHLDIRAHAAWNVKSLVQHLNVPYMVVADHFGDGVPDFNFNFNADPSDFNATSPDWHGYHVLGIIGGTYGGDTSDRGRVTGIYPGRLPLGVVDKEKGYSDPMVRLKIVERLTTVGKAVVNTSLSLPCNGGFADRSCVEPAALSWIERLRGTGLYRTGLTGPESLENTFLHVTAAGNVKEDAPSDTDAKYASDWNAARYLPLVHPGNGNPIMNLTNTLVIENREKSPTPLEGLGYLNTTSMPSKYPGDLSGIGTDVFSFMGATTGTDYASGTSAATPQVAGLAAYLWAIKPDLTPQQIIDILASTADASPCGGGNPQPRALVDAYGAVLALDRSYTDIKVRGTLLDVVDWTGTKGPDRLFTEKDIETFLNAFDAANGAKDYSRYDLNGDGKTGGTETRSFNLDMDYPPTYGTVHQIIEGTGVSFNENNLNDLDILCYYAYSRLYAGSESKRKELLGEKCVKHGLKLMVGTPLINNEPVQTGDPLLHAFATAVARTGCDNEWEQNVEYNPCLNCDLPPFQYDGCTVTGGGFLTVDAGTSVTYDASAYMNGGAFTSMSITNNNDGTELVFSLLGSTLADPTMVFFCDPYGYEARWGSESWSRTRAMYTVIDITNAKDHPVNLHISWDYTMDGTPFDPEYDYYYGYVSEVRSWYGESYPCPSDTVFPPFIPLFSVWCNLTECRGPLSGSRTLRIDPGHVQYHFWLESMSASDSSGGCSLGDECSLVPIVVSTSYSGTVTFRLEDP